MIIHSEFKELIEIYKNKRSKAENHSKNQKNQFSSKDRKDDRHLYEFVTMNKMSERQKSFVSRNSQNVHFQIQWSYDRHIREENWHVQERFFFQHHHRSIWSTFRDSFILIRSNVLRALRWRKFLRSSNDSFSIRFRALTTSSTNCFKHALSLWSNYSHFYSKSAFNCFITRRRLKRSTRSLWRKRKKMITSFRKRIDS